MASDFVIKEAETAEEIAAAKRLIEEYAAWMDVDLAYQDFDKEMARFPAAYKAPRGRLLIAVRTGDVVGVVGLKHWNVETCEMKRLWVTPGHKGRGLGLALVSELIGLARRLGYRRMQLDTIRGQHDKAIRLYRRFGFTETKPYYEGAVRNTLFLSMRL